MTTLRDGTVIPHFLGVGVNKTNSQFFENLSDNLLKQGQVIKIHAPDDDTNFSKKFYEYDVLAIDTAGASNVAKKVYFNCIMADKFGSQADFERWQPRFVSEPGKSDTVTENTRVLIHCIDGNTDKAIIVGCMKHPNLYGNSQKEPTQTGPYYESEYNGINIKINDQGEFELTRRGPTNPKGEATDTSDAVGYKITITKDGSAKFVTGDGDQVIEWNHPEKKVKINATNGVELGGGEHLVLGDTYRAAEDQLLVQTYLTLTQILAILQSISVAAASITITAHIQAAIDPLLIPLMSTFQLPLSTFQGSSATYLSKTNTTK